MTEIDGFRIDCNIGTVKSFPKSQHHPPHLVWSPPIEEGKDRLLFNASTAFYAFNKGKGWIHAVGLLNEAIQKGGGGLTTQAGNEYLKSVVVTIEEIK